MKKMIMGKRHRVIAIRYEVEKSLIVKGELTIQDLVNELSHKGMRFQVTPFELSGMLRAHPRIEKTTQGVYAISKD
jgi:hypothetical protein|tara:strand:+ start:1914 stop:2141 length:228 start_codon:yes stop_codon:yes gene_type:complete